MLACDYCQPDSKSLLELDLATSSQVEAVHPRDSHLHRTCAELFCSTLCRARMYLKHQVLVKKEVDKMLHK